MFNGSVTLHASALAPPGRAPFTAILLNQRPLL
jgi:hypothetical protein